MLYTEIVNKNNPYKKKKINLIETLNKDNNKVLLEKEAFYYYEQLKEYLKTIGIEIAINEAYRSIEDQEKIVEEFKNIYEEEKLYKKVAVPGYSEHHTGLAIDIGLIFDKREEEEENIKIRESLYQEMHKHLSKFGFILRYPKGKEKITGYSYEPWHIRYVGKIPAEIIMNNNLTLEEYVNDFQGVLFINKEKNKTSFDIVNEISHLFGIKKVGHSGTLDPNASGVMTILVGEGTKLSKVLVEHNKEYKACLKLGIKTQTADSEGKIIEEQQYSLSDKIDEIEACFRSFVGKLKQIPPMYSAIKVDGKKLYEYARKGKEVERKEREVEIFSICIDEIRKEDNEIDFTVSCSKGTYIRTLCEQIAEKLGTVGYMKSLIRTKVNDKCILILE